MRVLGLSASSRPWGNTDLLVRHALNGAEAEGAQTRFLRITDLALQPCKGCMSCVSKNRDCATADGLPRLLESMRWADGVVVGSPTYVLGATGEVKTLQDRLIRFGFVREFTGKTGLVVAAAGVRGWEPFVLPQIALTFLFLGMPIVDQFIGYGQGPGEIFDDPGALERAGKGGAALAQGDRRFRGDPGACPVCHFDLVITREDGSAHCPLCDLPGRWVEAERRLHLEPVADAEPRWTEGMMHRHFVEKVLPSGPRFKARLKEIRRRVDALRGPGEA